MWLSGSGSAHIKFTIGMPLDIWPKLVETISSVLTTAAVKNVSKVLIPVTFSGRTGASRYASW